MLLGVNVLPFISITILWDFENLQRMLTKDCELSIYMEFIWKYISQSKNMDCIGFDRYFVTRAKAEKLWLTQK